MSKQCTSKNILAGILLAAGFACAPIAQAALEDLGNGVIKDTDLNIEWLADANYSQTSGYNTTGLMTWNAAEKWVDQLNVGGYSDWRLPTTDEFSHLFYDELDGVVNNRIYDIHNNANFALFSNIQSGVLQDGSRYWTATPTSDVAIHSTFSFKNGLDFTDNGSVGRYAMAVHSGSLVPEPETYAMMLAGLGLLGWRLRNTKN
jgi:hypothetical protein